MNSVDNLTAFLYSTVMKTKNTNIALATTELVLAYGIIGLTYDLSVADMEKITTELIAKLKASEKKIMEKETALSN